MNRNRFVGIVALLVSGVVVQAGESGVQAVDSTWAKAMKANSVEAIAIIWRLAEGKLTELELASWIRQNNEAADD